MNLRERVQAWGIVGVFVAMLVGPAAAVSIGLTLEGYGVPQAWRNRAALAVLIAAFPLCLGVGMLLGYFTRPR